MNADDKAKEVLRNVLGASITAAQSATQAAQDFVADKSPQIRQQSRNAKMIGQMVVRMGASKAGEIVGKDKASYRHRSADSRGSDQTTNDTFGSSLSNRYLNYSVLSAPQVIALLPTSEQRRDCIHTDLRNDQSQQAHGACGDHSSSRRVDLRMFIIREASITDVASVNILEDSAFESLSNFRGLAQFLETSPRIGDGWSEIIEDSKFKLFVGVLGETIHGYLLVEVFAGLHKALIKQVFVDSTARQLGLGALLIERCEQVVRDTGCTVLEGLALPGDRDMKNLFERASMSAQLLIVGKNLA